MGGVFSFLIPNLLIPDSSNVHEVENGMKHLNYTYVGNSLVIFILLITCKCRLYQQVLAWKKIVLRTASTDIQGH